MLRRPLALLPLAASLVVALLCPSRAPAATFLETSVEELARDAEVVVRGKVLRTVSRWEGGRIVTEAEIAVASAWKGAPGEKLAVVVPGGRVGDLAQKVSGAPSFRSDEEVVVFAGRAGPRRLGVVGLALGKYRVEQGVATPQLDGVRLEPRRLAAGERLAAPMNVDELERRVRATR